MKEEPITPRSARSSFLWLERITAGVLLAVLLALGWMVLVAYQPGWLRMGCLACEVENVVILLGAALILVSVVALLHTRS